MIGAIAFDLDGTLIDSAPDIAHALNSALESERIAGFPPDAVRAWVGDGPDATIQRALAARGIGTPETALKRRLREVFDRATLEAPFRLGRVYPGIGPMLQSLARRLPLVCVTNKPAPLARAVLDAARLLPQLVEVFGGDVPEWRKPAPTLLHRAAARCGVPPARLLMVGDGAQDILAARAAGCPMALVAWGYGHGIEAADASVWRVPGPDHLLRGIRNIKEGDGNVDWRAIHPDAVPDRGAAAPP